MTNEQSDDAGQFAANVEVEWFIENQTRFLERARDVCVLFADLVGSTEFKRDHKPHEGLAKTLLHNRVATRVVVEFQGSVVKYIGDAVMAVFKNVDCASNALNAAIKILLEIEAENARMDWGYPKAMSTRVGVAFGKVWMFTHKESSIEDPQGTTVDIAARLSSVGAPQQVVCTESTFQKAGGEAKVACQSGNIRRYVRGITEPLDLRVLVPKNWHCDLSSLQGIPQALPKEIREGVRLLRQKNELDALRTFEDKANRDRGNFHANLYAGTILLRRAQNREDIEKASKYLCRAKWSRPSSSRVWLYLSWVQFRSFELNGPEESLNLAIRYAESSVNCADDGINEQSSTQARTFLAHYLLRRSKLKNPGSQEDLARAHDICGEVSRSIELMVDKQRLEYYVTHAFILLARQAPNDVELAEEMIQKALSIEPKFVRALDAQRELIKVRGTPPDGPIIPGM